MSAQSPTHDGKSHQLRAMMRKNITLQIRYKWANLCQIVVPVILILFAGLMQLIVNELTPIDPPTLVEPPAVPLNLYMGMPKTNNSLFYQKYYFATLNGTDEAVGSLDDEGFGTGLLSQIIFKVPFEINKTHTISTPFFIKKDNESQIDNDIYNELETLRGFNPALIKDDSSLFYLLPTGAAVFRDLKTVISSEDPNDDRSLRMQYSISINDNKFYQRKQVSSKQFTVTFNKARLMSLVNGAFLHTCFGDTMFFSAIKGFPFILESQTFNVMDILGIALFPFAVSFLMPVYLYTLVMEKEHRLREMMRMMGVKLATYWMTTYLFDYIFYVIVCIVFVITELCFQVRFFTQSSPLLTFLLFFLWGHVQVSMAFLLSTFFSKSRAATVFGYMLVIASVISSEVFNGQVFQEAEPPVWYWIYPPYAFFRGVYLMFMGCHNFSCLQIADLVADDSQIRIAFIAMAVQSVAMMILAAYLNVVVPQEFGVAKHPLFFLKPIGSLLYRYIYVPIRYRGSYNSLNGESTAHPVIGTPSLTLSASGDDEDAQSKLEAGEDEDVVAERKRVNQRQYPANAPLVLIDLHKKYNTGLGKAPKVALKKVSLAIEEGECFGLLGPNGAGKTTMMSILFGLYPPTAGTALVGGYDIRTEMDQIHKIIGVCPQFDVLWDELTVLEHLLFYSRLKGIPIGHEMQHAEQLAASVGLSSSIQKRSRELSGGMKRRLSLAIAMVGNPRVLFMDEPTTGLDPESKRSVWDCISRSKEGKCMVLTTHSMEEASVLCGRIGIITRGSMQCIGDQLYLKNKFGQGYRLNIAFDVADTAKAQSFIARLLPDANLISDFPGVCVYQVPRKSIKVSRLFSEIEANKLSMGIKDWGLTQTSLEDVFIRIVDAAE